MEVQGVLVVVIATQEEKLHIVTGHSPIVQIQLWKNVLLAVQIVMSIVSLLVKVNTGVKFFCNLVVENGKTFLKKS